jgi:hypothetical protein
MESAVATPAPAQPAAPESTISATRAAANSGSFADFEAADRAARAGTPLPAVPVKADAAAPAQPAAAAPVAPAAPAQPDAPAVSKRQQEINDHIRRATTAETENARLREENARLKGTAPRADAPPAAPAQPEAPTVAKFPTLEQWSAAHPEKSFDDFLEARDEHREQQRTAAAHARTTADEQAGVLEQRVTGFQQQLEAAKTADPTFLTKLTPEVQALRPHWGLPAADVGPANIVATQVFASAVAPRVLLHFSEHPEALAKLTTMPAAIAALPASVRISEHIQYIVREFGKLEHILAASAAPAAPAAPASATPAGAAPSTITAAPAPPETLTRTGVIADPQAAALARNDFAEWDRVETAKEQAKRKRA